MKGMGFSPYKNLPNPQGFRPRGIIFLHTIFLLFVRHET